MLGPETPGDSRQLRVVAWGPHTIPVEETAPELAAEVVMSVPSAASLAVEAPLATAHDEDSQWGTPA